MKTQHYSILFSALVAMLIMGASCSKDRITNDTDTEFASLDDFYDMNEPEEQEFLIDSIGGDTITGMYGTKIWGIPKEIFMKKSDHTDITYPYTLKLTEVYGVKDMIFARLPGEAQGSMLYSAGELRFRAFKDSDELELKEHCGLPFMAPSTSTDALMELFYGFTTGTTTDWNVDVLQAGYLFANDDVTEIATNSYGYQAKTAKMGWTNIARKFTSSSQSSFTFTAEGTNTNFIDIYIVFNNLNSYVKVVNQEVSGLPDGEPVTVFAIAKDAAQQMYYFKENFTTNLQMQVELDMTPATESEILTIMDTL